MGLRAFWGLEVLGLEPFGRLLGLMDFSDFSIGAVQGPGFRVYWVQQRSVMTSFLYHALRGQQARFLTHCTSSYSALVRLSSTCTCARICDLVAE